MHVPSSAYLAPPPETMPQPRKSLYQYLRSSLDPSHASLYLPQEPRDRDTKAWFFPRLETFVTLIEGHYENDGPCSDEDTHFLAEDFIDAADPSSDPLRPWACESSLKVFCAKITGIPRPDITHFWTTTRRKHGLS
ncbi:hypothetical protein BKA57DRAFT_490216 [Linnemannia elongata]|nr:hypothetical protein BKA57DRAFT_490216 [Linnemannia elongata]